MMMRPNSPLRCPPLFGTPRTPGRVTLGEGMGEIARRLGKPLMEHQQYMADVALEIDPATGLLAYPEVIVIGPRQNTGKSEWLFDLMTHRCVAKWPEGAQRVLYTAQTADEARLRWRDVHLTRLLKTRTIKSMFTPRLALNREAMLWHNGSHWSPISTTGKTGGTGDTIDLGVIDEAWSRPDFRTELSMGPAMDTRDWSQLVIASMIPGITRAKPGTWTYLKEKRRIGRARVEAGVNHGVAIFDFAAVEGSDPGDPRTWYSCMPGLGVTAAEAKIAARFNSLPLVDFCAEYLGWEPVETVATWTLLPQVTWDKHLDVDSAIVGPMALGVEITEDRTQAYIGVSGRRADGHWHGEIVEPGRKIPIGTLGTEWLERRVLELLEVWKPCTTVIDKRRPANSLIVPLTNAGYDVYTPNGPDITAACGQLYDRICDEPDPDRQDLTHLFHLGQNSLDRAVSMARKVEAGAGVFTFVRRNTEADISPLYAVVLAMLGVEVKGPLTVPDPEIFY